MKRPLLLSLFALHLSLFPGLPAARADDTHQGALLGTFYDLKQNQEREPSGENPKTYRTVLTHFYEDNWNEDVLNAYYRVSKPYHATQIYLPMVNSDTIPGFFGIKGFVKPGMWVVEYKGQIVAPMDGVYRFCGLADDIMSVRVNNRLVLVTGRPDCLPPASVWKAPGRTSRGLTAGDWFPAKAGEILDFEAIIGDRPGGVFYARLYIEKQGEPDFVSTFPPIFKVAPSENPARGDFTPDTAWSVWSAKP